MVLESQRLSASQLRSIDRDTHLVIDLHEDEYWDSGEGKVETVTEYDSGEVHVILRGLRGYRNVLKIPSDARKGLRFDGAAKGARNLRVSSVYER